MYYAICRGQTDDRGVGGVVVLGGGDYSHRGLYLRGSACICIQGRTASRVALGPGLSGSNLKLHRWLGPQKQF